MAVGLASLVAAGAGGPLAAATRLRVNFLDSPAVVPAGAAGAQPTLSWIAPVSARGA